MPFFNNLFQVCYMISFMQIMQILLAILSILKINNFSRIQLSSFCMEPLFQSSLSLCLRKFNFLGVIFRMHQMSFKTILQEVPKYMSNLVTSNMPQTYTQASIIADTTSLNLSRENGMRFKPCFKLFFKTLFENKFKFMVVTCGILKLKSMWNLSCVKGPKYS